VEDDREMLRGYFEGLSTIEVSRHGLDRLCADGLISDSFMFRENQRVKFIPWEFEGLCNKFCV